MKTIIDHGHRYTLLTLDGDLDQTLTFVKRHDPVRPWRFPGNHNSYPGTTLQSVIRCLLERTRYLQNQIWCPENWIITRLLRLCLWLLEFRAARRHGSFYLHTTTFAETAHLCPTCGHTQCEHDDEN